MSRDVESIKEGLIADAWTVVGTINGAAGGIVALTPEIQHVLGTDPINPVLAGGIGIAGLVAAGVSFKYAHDAEQRAAAIDASEPTPSQTHWLGELWEHLHDTGTRGVFEMGAGMCAGLGAVTIAAVERLQLNIASTPGRAAAGLMCAAAVGLLSGVHDINNS